MVFAAFAFPLAGCAIYLLSESFQHSARLDAMEIELGQMYSSIEALRRELDETEDSALERGVRNATHIDIINVRLRDIDTVTRVTTMERDEEPPANLTYLGALSTLQDTVSDLSGKLASLERGALRFGEPFVFTTSGGSIGVYSMDTFGTRRFENSDEWLVQMESYNEGAEGIRTWTARRP